MSIAISAAQAQSPELAQRIDKLFQEFDAAGRPGAAVLVIHEGKPIFAKGYGLANVEEKILCTTNTNFRLASVTKQFTAMAVLILTERKKLSLDEQLTDFFAEFPAYGKQIATRHLLTHTSGLIDYEDVIPAGTIIPILDRDVLRLMLQQDKTYFPPGTKYRYSNTAYALLAQIVEVRSGKTFAAFLKESIFDPLQMTNTVAYEQGISVVPNRAFGYTQRGNEFERTDQSLTSSVLGDGGIYSSLADLFKWDQALYSTRLVRAKILQQAFTAQTPTDKPDRSYGFGWYIGDYRGLKEIWHSGETCGFTTRIARFPEKQFSMIILTNRRNAQLDGLPEKVVDLVLFPPK